MAPFASLPQEIVDNFVDELAVLCEASTSNVRHRHVLKENLRRCMQVSRFFRTRARRLLFSDVTLVINLNQTSTKSSRDFRILLNGDPGLAKQVSSFRVDFIYYPSEPVETSWPFCPNLTVKDRHLPFILRMLGSLRMLGLASLCPSDVCLAFDPPIQAAIFNLHEYPLIETIELSGNNLSIPIEFVSRWRTLRSVTIHGSPFIRTIHENVRQQRRRQEAPSFPVPRYIKDREFAQVKALFLRFGSLSFSIAEEEGFLRQLSDLKADIHRPFDWRWLWEVMQMRCTTLKTVFIRNLFSSMSTDEVIQVARSKQLDFRNLRSFELQERCLHIRPAVRHMHFVAHAVTTYFTSSSPRLESIRISLTYIWPAVHVTLSDDDVITPHSWSQLDEKLAAFPSFQVLEVNVNYVYESLGIASAWKHLSAKAFERWSPESTFPLLSKRNVVVRITVLDFTKSR